VEIGLYSIYSIVYVLAFWQVALNERDDDDDDDDDCDDDDVFAAFRALILATFVLVVRYSRRIQNTAGLDNIETDWDSLLKVIEGQME